jgi:hypothetical protein
LKGYSNDELKLKLFSMSLTNTALAWYRVCPAESLSTWDKLKGEFISRFYPKVKSSGATRAIKNFKNRQGESLVRAYTNFRGMINKCPHHDLLPWYVLHIFYGGLNQDSKNKIDLALDGAFMESTITKVLGTSRKNSL